MVLIIRTEADCDVVSRFLPEHAVWTGWHSLPVFGSDYAILAGNTESGRTDVTLCVNVPRN